MEDIELFNIKLCWGNFGFEFVHSPSVGNSGGILCIWDPRLFRKLNSTISDYFVIIQGEWAPNGKKLIIISVYAPQELREKKMLWDYLILVLKSWNGDVIIMGDFNEVRTQDERHGSIFNAHGADAFNLFISSAGLEEVPLDGCKFTWCHKSGSKMSKLDRFLISEGLLNSCPNISSITLDRYLSDHRPILMRESHHDYGPSPFRFFHYWFELEGFDTFVKQTWNDAQVTDLNAISMFMKKMKYLKEKIRLCQIRHDGVGSKNEDQMGDRRRRKFEVLSRGRAPRAGAEELQYIQLVKIMEGITLFDLKDRWRWSLEGCGEFTIASVRNLLDANSLSVVSSKTRWIKAVPIKFNIHAWKVKLDILPTRLNISKRGMDIESILCPLCEKNVESSSHIFFTCPISREIFRKVLLWWEIDVVMVSSYDENADTTLRPADVLVFGWVGGRHACVDLTGVSSLVGLSSRGFTVGQAALKAASCKVTKHEKTCIENQHVFIPFAFDTFGFLAPEAVEILTRVQRVMNSKKASFMRAHRPEEPADIQRAKTAKGVTGSPNQKGIGQIPMKMISPSLGRVKKETLSRPGSDILTSDGLRMLAMSRLLRQEVGITDYYYKSYFKSLQRQRDGHANVVPHGIFYRHKTKTTFRTSGEIHHIKQRDGESTGKDLMELRYKKKSGREWRRDMHEVPGEVAAFSHGRKKAPTPWKQPEGGNKPSFKKGFKNKHSECMQLRKQIDEMIKAEEVAIGKKVTQSFSSETTISFPPLGDEDGTEGPMIIEAEIGRHFVYRMYVDRGASSEILYEHCFVRLWPEIKRQMVPPIPHNLTKCQWGNNLDAGSRYPASEKLVRKGIPLPHGYDIQYRRGHQSKANTSGFYCGTAEADPRMYPGGNRGNTEETLDPFYCLDILTQFNKAEDLGLVCQTTSCRPRKYMKDPATCHSSVLGEDRYSLDLSGKIRPTRGDCISNENNFVKTIQRTGVRKISIRQCFAIVKHPQNKCLVKRAIRSFGGRNSRLGLDERSKDWMGELSHVLWAHRTMIKSSNGETPFSLTYGTEAVIPAEIGMPTLRNAEIDLIKNDESLEINLGPHRGKKKRAS
ncbi:RNA-directed DNA polymerase, eukaryota [Tanacetum coccineum]|uniref:RNA-directed DNA polymerase, eukaryota n=1 Tax=Tanacetum coccineum TaxID=301880 RepID=A0ABQ4WEI9_9ASTR